MRRSLVLRPDGTAKAVYSDKLPLRALGHVTMERASMVEWDDIHQEWFAVELATGRILAHGPSRDEVVSEEIRVLEEGL